MPEGDKVAILEIRLENHEKICGERYSRIANDTQEIKKTLATISKDMRDATARIHDRIDMEKKERADAVQMAKEGIQANRNGFLVTAAAVLLGIVAFFVAPFFKTG